MSMVLCAVFAMTLVSIIRAHSYLVEPSADWKDPNRAHCRRGGPERFPPDKCDGPCIDPGSWFYRKEAQDTPAVWRRGDKVQVLWTKNGHKSGFIRLTLVPVGKRRSYTAHERGTFHYACFDSNPRKCDKNKYACGTDDKLYGTEVRVPDDVKDGLYVLGWAWYGAANMQRGKVTYKFGDYWSCAYIRVRGGEFVARKRRKLRFAPGTGEERCSAISNRLHQCTVEPCKDKLKGHKRRMLCPYGMGWKDGKCDTGDDEEESKVVMVSEERKNRIDVLRAKEEERREEQARKERNEKDDDKKKQIEEDKKEVGNGKKQEEEVEEKENRKRKVKVDEVKEKKIKRIRAKFAKCKCRTNSRIRALQLVPMHRNGRPTGEAPLCLCPGSRRRLLIRTDVAVVAVVKGKHGSVRLAVNGHKVLMTDMFRRGKYVLLGRFKAPVRRTVRLEVGLRGERTIKVEIDFL